MLIKSLRRLKHPPNCHIGNCGNSAVATVARRRCGAGRAQSGWPGCGMRVDWQWAPVWKGPEGWELGWCLHIALTFTLFCFCSRTKWFQCALIWQSDPRCCGTVFRSAAAAQCSMHGLAIADAGPFSCSLFTHDARAGVLCFQCSPKHGTCESRLAWPWINSSPPHRPCCPG